MPFLKQLIHQNCSTLTKIDLTELTESDSWTESVFEAMSGAYLTQLHTLKVGSIDSSLDDTGPTINSLETVLR